LCDLVSIPEYDVRNQDAEHDAQRNDDHVTDQFRMFYFTVESHLKLGTTLLVPCEKNNVLGVLSVRIAPSDAGV